jgi:hypothetical protein
MRRLGIIQPGKIGDIIICLPIAKWYADKGYEVFWPVDNSIINNFLGYVDYVKFIPIDFNCKTAYQACYKIHCTTILDLAFCIPGANEFNAENYSKQDLFSFDEFKYYIANVPFKQKWNLKIKRNEFNEQKLLNSIGADFYFLVQDTSSDCRRLVNIEIDGYIRLDIDRRSNSVFDWIGALQQSKKLVLIESCFSNLVDQLGIKTQENILLLKHGYYGNNLKSGRPKGLPVLNQRWSVF